MSQTAKAMTYSVLASIAIVFAWMAINPQPEMEYESGVDAPVVAEEVSTVAAFTPATVNAPESWRTNFARWNSGSSDEVPAWNVGYLTEEDEFFGISQSAHANDGWIDDKISPVGEPTETTVANHDVTRWVGDDDHIYLVAEFDHDPDALETVEQAEAPEPSESMTLILSGSMEEQTLHQLAAEVINQYR
ncbi:MAG: DUF4245 domain-containing protein [Micrococcaceae bacterium]|nr:DUF4245 domain-containing protein [Micrococcaceae bacterium]